MIKILYFGRLPQAIGREAEDIHLPRTVKDIEGLLAHLRQRGDIWDKGLRPERLKITVNKEFVEPDQAIADGDEIALVSIGL